MNWRDRPLTSHEVIVNTIAAATTRTGLTVRAGLDAGARDTGTKISDRQMQALPLTRHPGLALATVLHQRLALPPGAIAARSGARPETVSKRIRDIRQLPPCVVVGHTAAPIAFTRACTDVPTINQVPQLMKAARRCDVGVLTTRRPPATACELHTCSISGTCTSTCERERRRGEAGGQPVTAASCLRSSP